MNNSERIGETEQLSGARAKADVQQTKARREAAGSAFPYEPQAEYAGLTKREYMATAIMAGLCNGSTGSPDPRYAARLSTDAVAFADALLLELAK